MIPAHSSGAASTSVTPSGIRYTYAAGTDTYSAKQPSASQPVYSDPRHRFSRPVRHQRHRPHVRLSHGTPTRSPVASEDTPRPTATTSPTPSCPGTVRGAFGASSRSARCRSVRHTPQAVRPTTTSPSPGVGTGRDAARIRPSTPGDPVTSQAVIVVMGTAARSRVGCGRDLRLRDGPHDPCPPRRGVGVGRRPGLVDLPRLLAQLHAVLVRPRLDAGV